MLHKMVIIVMYYQMLALLEEMYHELGLVEELDIHPSTLKRCCREVTQQTIF